MSEQDATETSGQGNPAAGEAHLGVLPPGQRLQEYEFVSVLGVGGFGITYLARDTQLQMRVAIKEYLPASFAVRVDGLTVHPRSRADEEDYRWGLDRFLKEAQTLARFRHANIVRVMRFFEANGTAYMVMEYEEGQSLAEYLTAHDEPLEEGFVRSLLMPLLEGLKGVHQAGYLHRDIKPNNIYLRRDMTPVLIDFGSARQALGTHTQNLTSVYTPGYAPFEQYLQEGRQGPWTDIYALGAVLYRMVAGYSPFDAATRMKGDTLVPAVRVGAGRFGRPFLQAIDQALRMDERQRPQSIDAWLQQLNGAPATVATQVAHGQAAVAATEFSASLANRQPGAMKPAHDGSAASRPTPVPRTTGRSVQAKDDADEPNPWPKRVLALALIALVAWFWHRNRTAPAVPPLPPSVQTDMSDRRDAGLPDGQEAAAPPGPDLPAMREEPAKGAVETSEPATPVRATPVTPSVPERNEPPMRDNNVRQGLDERERQMIEERFRRADLENRGSLSRQQAAVAFPMVARNLDRIDRDGDGRLSLDEVTEALAIKRQMQNGRY